MSNSRTASEVILELEQKVNVLLNLVKTLDLNIKVISNKLNAIGVNSSQNIVQTVQQSQVAAPMFSISLPDEALQDDRNMKIAGDSAAKVEQNPVGFRRTSRPETYENKQQVQPIFVEPEIIAQQSNVKDIPSNATVQGIIPIMQRVLDKNGKALFLANVEIIDQNTGKQFYKTRTNGTGKWMASLPIGKYKVLISRLEQLTKERVASMQELIVDGSQNPLELPVIVAK